MKIGIVLGNFDPKIGGGYTFVSTVLESLLDLASESQHQFCIFYESKNWDAAMHEHKHVRYCPIPKRGWFGKAFVALKHFSPIFANLMQKVPTHFERAARKQEIQLLWFLGGGVYDTVDIPYIATVWDIQHRTHPWFPEVSEKGIWDYREALHARFLRRAIIIITGTEIGKEQLGWFYQIPPERVRIFPHPVPNLISIPIIKQSIKIDSLLDQKKFILYPAQFWAHKNHVNLLHAFKSLQENVNDAIHLVFTGSDKGNESYVRKIAIELGISARVHFLGFVDVETLIWLYQHAEALVYPSFSGPENLPPLEALMHGCPVVIADYPGAREQLNDAALFFNPHDPKDLSNTLCYLLSNPEKREKLLVNGNHLVRSRSVKDYMYNVFKTFDGLDNLRRCWL